MANASHQSKQKQQTLKKESQTSPEPATNGQTQQGDMPWSEKDKVYLSVEQAELFKQLLAASNEAQNQVQFFLVAAGISGQDVIGGDLDAEKPYFLVKDSE